MAEHKCAECPIRAKHDEKPKSFTGRFWRWHINFCPGWKRYYNSMDKEEKQKLKLQYNLKK